MQSTINIKATVNRILNNSFTLKYKDKYKKLL